MLPVSSLSVVSIQPADRPVKGIVQIAQVLDIGQQLKATVVGAEQGGNYLLEAGNSKVLVRSDAQLMVGQILDVEVGGTKQNIELQILPSSVHRFFGQTLSGTAGKPDLTNIFSLFQNTSTHQIQNFSQSSTRIMQQFTDLVQSSFASTADRQQVDSGTSLRRFLTYSAVQIESSFSAGKEKGAVRDLHLLVKDVSRFFVAKNEMQPSLQAEISSSVSPKGRAILEGLFLLQKTAPEQLTAQIENKLPATRTDIAIHTILEKNGIDPQRPFIHGKPEMVVAQLSKGFAELFFLLKSPGDLKNYLQMNPLRSDVFSSVQQQNSLLFSPTEMVGENRGRMLQELGAQLGLQLERNLSQGNREAATNTVKFALLDLIQNSKSPESLIEAGKQTLNSIEFFQLAQLQLSRNDIFILPLPFHFLQKGFLLVENNSKKDKTRGENQSQTTRFSLYLTLEELGDLKIDFYYANTGLFINFNSSSKQVSEFLSQYSDDLKNNISDVPVEDISFSVGAEDPILELVKKCASGEESFFNIKI